MNLSYYGIDFENQSRSAGFDKDQSKFILTLLEALYSKINADFLDHAKLIVNDLVASSIRKEVRKLLSEIYVLSDEIEKVVKNLEKSISDTHIEKLIKKTNEAKDMINSLQVKAVECKREMIKKLQTIYNISDVDFDREKKIKDDGK